MKYNKGILVAAAALTVVTLISIFAFLSPYDPDALDMTARLQGPSAAHWFGTDDLGRDYLTRVLYGGRISLIVGVVAMLISTVIGVTVGTVSGYFGGVVDNILMRIVDVLMSIPWMILVTVISIYMRPGLQAIILVIGLFQWMNIARLVRAETLSVKEREYVLYSESINQSHDFIILKHVIPWCCPPSSWRHHRHRQRHHDRVRAQLLGLACSSRCPWGSMLNRAQASWGRPPTWRSFRASDHHHRVLVQQNGDLIRVFAEPRAIER